MIVANQARPLQCKMDRCNGVGKLDSKGKTRYFIKGFCNKHYLRYRRGKPLEYTTTHERRRAIIEGAVAKIPLGLDAKDGYAIVDSDQSWVDKYFWHLNGQGYAVTSTKDQGLLRLHHLVFEKPTKPLVTDHIDRDRLNNRRSNLRHVTSSENALNRGGSTGKYYRGVRRRTDRGFNHRYPFSAVIYKDGVHYFLGYYDTEEKAALAYDKAARELHGPLARLNFGDKD